MMRRPAITDGGKLFRFITLWMTSLHPYNAAPAASHKLLRISCEPGWNIGAFSHDHPVDLREGGLSTARLVGRVTDQE